MLDHWNKRDFRVVPGGVLVEVPECVTGRAGCRANAALADASSLWSKAQAAFATGNMNEAVSTAADVKSKLQAVAATIKLDLAAPAA